VLDALREVLPQLPVVRRWDSEEWGWSERGPPPTELREVSAGDLHRGLVDHFTAQGHDQAGAARLAGEGVRLAVLVTVGSTVFGHDARLAQLTPEQLRGAMSHELHEHVGRSDVADGHDARAATLVAALGLAPLADVEQAIADVGRRAAARRAAARRAAVPGQRGILTRELRPDEQARLAGLVEDYLTALRDPGRGRSDILLGWSTWAEPFRRAGLADLGEALISHPVTDRSGRTWWIGFQHHWVEIDQLIERGHLPSGFGELVADVAHAVDDVDRVNGVLLLLEKARAARDGRPVRDRPGVTSRLPLTTARAPQTAIATRSPAAEYVPFRELLSALQGRPPAQALRVAEELGLDEAKVAEALGQLRGIDVAEVGRSGRYSLAPGGAALLAALRHRGPIQDLALVEALIHARSILGRPVTAWLSLQDRGLLQRAARLASTRPLDLLPARAPIDVAAVLGEVDEVLAEARSLAAAPQPEPEPGALRDALHEIEDATSSGPIAAAEVAGRIRRPVHHVQERLGALVRLSVLTTVRGRGYQVTPESGELLKRIRERRPGDDPVLDEVAALLDGWPGPIALEEREELFRRALAESRAEQPSRDEAHRRDGGPASAAHPDPDTRQAPP
jgi:hypothetical protein